MRLVLASASPARLATLRAAGLDPEVVVSDVDEPAELRRVGAERPEQMVAVLALAKAEAVAERITGDAVVLGCDSLLDTDGTAHGKPGTDAAVRERWRLIAGREARLRTGHTAVRVRNGRTEQTVSRTSTTVVRFGEPTDAELDAYVASGEPQQVAGAFTIDGLGGWFVEAVDGDHHTVVGVSLPVVRALLGELGLGLLDVGWPTPA